MRQALIRLQYLLLIMCMLSCRSSMIRYSWTHPENINSKYDKILVVAITNKEDSSFRRQTEDYMVQRLNGLGYSTVSSLKEFGIEGLAHMNDVETYIKLCNTGIDAVFSLVLIDKHKRRLHMQGNVAKFYYDRIWNYRNLVAMGSEMRGAEGTNQKIYYESMVFDLRTLQPTYFVQTKFFTSYLLSQCFPCYEDKILQHMLGKKVFTK